LINKFTTLRLSTCHDPEREVEAAKGADDLVHAAVIENVVDREIAITNAKIEKEAKRDMAQNREITTNADPVKDHMNDTETNRMTDTEKEAAQEIDIDRKVHEKEGVPHLANIIRRRR
jgi:hypothetical protein